MLDNLKVYVVFWILLGQIPSNDNSLIPKFFPSGSMLLRMSIHTSGWKRLTHSTRFWYLELCYIQSHKPPPRAQIWRWAGRPGRRQFRSKPTLVIIRGGDTSYKISRWSLSLIFAFPADVLSRNKFSGNCSWSPVKDAQGQSLAAIVCASALFIF